MANNVSDARDKDILEAFCRFYTRAMCVSAFVLDTPDARQSGLGLPDGLLDIGGVEWDAEVGGCDNYEGQREDHGRIGHIRAELKPHLIQKFPNLTITVLVHGGAIPNTIDFQALRDDASAKIAGLKLEYDATHPLDRFPYIEMGAHEPISGIGPFISFQLLARDRMKHPLIDKVRTFMEAKERQHKQRREHGRTNPTMLLVDLWDLSLSNYQHFATAYARLVSGGLKLSSIHEIWLVNCYASRAYCNPVKLGDRHYLGTPESLPEFLGMNRINRE